MGDEAAKLLIRLQSKLRAAEDELRAKGDQIKVLNEFLERAHKEQSNKDELIEDLKQKLTNVSEELVHAKLKLCNLERTSSESSLPNGHYGSTISVSQHDDASSVDPLSPFRTVSAPASGIALTDAQRRNSMSKHPPPPPRAMSSLPPAPSPAVALEITMTSLDKSASESNTRVSSDSQRVRTVLATPSTSTSTTVASTLPSASTLPVQPSAASKPPAGAASITAPAAPNALAVPGKHARTETMTQSEADALDHLMNRLSRSSSIGRSSSFSLGKAASGGANRSPLLGGLGSRSSSFTLRRQEVPDITGQHHSETVNYNSDDDRPRPSAAKAAVTALPTAPVPSTQPADELEDIRARFGFSFTAPAPSSPHASAVVSPTPTPSHLQSQTSPPAFTGRPPPPARVASFSAGAQPAPQPVDEMEAIRQRFGMSLLPR